MYKNRIKFYLHLHNQSGIQFRLVISLLERFVKAQKCFQHTFVVDYGYLPLLVHTTF